MTSALGVTMAQKTRMQRIAMRQDLMIAFADRTPTKFSSTRNTGSTNAMPTATMSLMTKS